MAQDLQYVDAVRPQPAVVLKLQMLDYSIGHEILLLSKRNPIACLTHADFSKLPAHNQRVAVNLAALICSQTWKQNKNPHQWLWLWRFVNRKANFDLAIADFRNYRTAGSSFPIISDLQQKEAGRPLGSPLLSRLLNFVDGDFDYPLGLACWQYFSALEDDGRIHVENNHEQTIRTEIAQIEDEIKREVLEETQKGGK